MGLMARFELHPDRTFLAGLMFALAENRLTSRLSR